MQTILIPTDFSPSALDCTEALCAQLAPEEFTLVFVHTITLSDSITDLLMLSRRTRDYELVSSEFYDRCQQLTSSHPQLKKIRIEFFYGTTLAMFRNFLEANEITAVLDLANCSLSKLRPASADPRVLIGRARLPVITIVPSTPAPRDHRQEAFSPAETSVGELQEV